jgi:hypothetical protein
VIAAGRSGVGTSERTEKLGDSDVGAVQEGMRMSKTNTNTNVWDSIGWSKMFVVDAIRE